MINITKSFSFTLKMLLILPHFSTMNTLFILFFITFWESG
ncbi:hypothetical protein BV083_797 [Haemophilus influenzae]|nr:hypothetical protein BV083_797 [Haemophilus influenzae]